MLSAASLTITIVVISWTMSTESGNHLQQQDIAHDTLTINKCIDKSKDKSTTNHVKTHEIILENYQDLNL